MDTDNLNTPGEGSAPASVSADDLSAFATYKDFATAAVELRRPSFPQFFAPRPAPMTLTLAR